MADLSALTLNDAAGAAVLLHDPAPGSLRGVTQVTGLVGITAPRRSVRPRPTAHGTIDETRWTDEAIITIDAFVRGLTDADAFAQLRQVTGPMLATLEAPALLRWTEAGGGLALQRTVKLSGALDAPLKAEGVPLLRYQAILASADPRAYSQTLQTVASSTLSAGGGGMVFPRRFNFTFASSGGGTVSFTNAGNRGTPPVFRLYGYLVNPTVAEIGGAGRRIVLNGTIAAGDYLELDVARRTITLVSGGVRSPRSNFYSAGQSTWWELAPGTSQLQILAADFDATANLQVVGRSAWA